MKEKRKYNPPKASEEKERQKIFRFYKEGTKVQYGLMYKTKGVELGPRVERNKCTSKALKVLTQYNP